MSNDIYEDDNIIRVSIFMREILFTKCLMMINFILLSTFYNYSMSFTMSFFNIYLILETLISQLELWCLTLAELRVDIRLWVIDSGVVSTRD